MAKKKRELPPRRQPTQRQLPRRQKSRIVQGIILGLAALVIVAVLGLVGTGWYLNQYRPLHEVVITVNNAQFDMGYYLTMLKYYGKGQSIENLQFVASQVIGVIEQNELIRQGAAELDITASEDEINKELKETELSRDYIDIARAQILAGKLHDEYFGGQVPDSGEQRHIMAMLLESESKVNEIRARILAGESFANLAGQLSLDSYTKDKQGDLGWRPKGVLSSILGSSTIEEYAFGSEPGLLIRVKDETVSKNLGFWLIKLLERKDEPKQVHLQAILLGTEAEAQEIKARLDGGEDFATVAKEVTQYALSRESGGDLGWLDVDNMYAPFKDFISNTGIGAVSGPIRDEGVSSQGAYWLIKVIEKEDNRKLDEENKNLLKNKAFNDWLAQLGASSVMESTLDADKIAWAIARVYKELR